jgi:hypothetical protein
MATKYHRHAITETPDVTRALTRLQAEMGGERPDLRELLILGADTKADELRAARPSQEHGLQSLADMIRDGVVPVSLAAANEVRAHGWVHTDVAD